MSNECIFCTTPITTPFIESLPCRHSGEVCRGCIFKHIAANPVCPFCNRPVHRLRQGSEIVNVRGAERRSFLARQWQYICDLEEEWENSNGKELENRPGGSAESRVVWYRELMGESFGMAAEWAVHRIFCGQGTGTVDLQRAGMEVQRALEEEHIRYWPWWMKGEWDEYALGGPC